jgi:hypothetical protein
MVGRLRGQADGSRMNHDTSHDSDEILALFGAMRLARRVRSAHAMWKNERADNLLAFAEGCKRQFALILQSRGRVARYPPDPMTSPPNMRHHSTFFKGGLKASIWASLA